jgi:3'-phosphoadenosine 5'-phosphosulfate sulfotransferase (PAPS reductase)/FAD synthetase
MPTLEELRDFQALPLVAKIGLTRNRIREWVWKYGTGGVYVSFSGGKDSTVLLHIVREMYPDIAAVFVNTGLEYPEIQQFVKTFDNVAIL